MESDKQQKEKIDCYQQLIKNELEETIKDIEFQKSGGQGYVYTGKTKKNNKKVAIKQIVKNKNNEKYVKREEDVNKKLKNAFEEQQCEMENILVCLEIKDSDKCLYLIMDYYEQNLEDFLKQIKKEDKQYHKEIMIQIVAGLKQLKDLGIAHRDLKPTNVLVNYDKVKCNFICKLADFGYSKIYNENDKNSSSAGTKLYTDPYIIYEFDNLKCGQIEYHDLYSLGIVFYQIVTQQIYFQMSNLQKQFDSKMNSQNSCKQGIENFQKREFQNYDESVRNFIENIIKKLIIYKPEDRANLEDIQELIKNQNLVVKKNIIKNKLKKNNDQNNHNVNPSHKSNVQNEQQKQSSQSKQYIQTSDSYQPQIQMMENHFEQQNQEDNIYMGQKQQVSTVSLIQNKNQITSTKDQQQALYQSLQVEKNQNEAEEQSIQYNEKVGLYSVQSNASIDNIQFKNCEIRDV